MEDKALVIFENFKIRRHYDEKKEKWYFSVVDIVQALIEQADFQRARKYWNKLKERLKMEGNQSVTNCHQLKMIAEDGKMRNTDVADVETLLRLVQSVPSPKNRYVGVRFIKPCPAWKLKFNLRGVIMKKIYFMLTFSLLPGVLFASPLSLDIETGLAVSGYNDVRIPGDTGTKISLSKDFKSENVMFYRTRINYSFNERKTLSLLIAPLIINASGKVDKAIVFNEANFPANTEIDAVYKFNSYRLTYRYEIDIVEPFQFGLGITGKIRDAKISLKSSTEESTKKDLGFVPLINFRCFYSVNSKLGLLFTGDALAAPQGRAEDVLTCVTYNVSDDLRFKMGYRFLEGGADNDKVYTFALIHYFVVGCTIAFD
ncbi:MAG: hypothetical protein ABH857_00165 [Elusimicrobiota bacterium]